MKENKLNQNPFGKPQFKKPDKTNQKKQLPISNRYCSDLMQDISSQNVPVPEQSNPKYKVPAKMPQASSSPLNPLQVKEQNFVEEISNLKEENNQVNEQEDIDNLSEPIASEPEAEVEMKEEQAKIENIFNNPLIKSDKSINKQATNGIGIGEVFDNNQEEEKEEDTQLPFQQIEQEQNKINSHNNNNTVDNTELKFEITVNNNFNPLNCNKDQQQLQLQHDINQESIENANNNNHNSSPQTTESKEINSEVEKLKEENKDANGNGNDNESDCNNDNNQESEQLFSEHKESVINYDSKQPSCSKKYFIESSKENYYNNEVCDIKMQREINDFKIKMKLIENENKAMGNELKKAKDEIKKQKEIINLYIRKELNEGESALKKQIEILTNTINNKEKINQALTVENKKLIEHLDNSNQFIKEYIEKSHLNEMTNFDQCIESNSLNDQMQNISPKDELKPKTFAIVSKEKMIENIQTEQQQQESDIKPLQPSLDITTGISGDKINIIKNPCDNDKELSNAKEIAIKSQNNQIDFNKDTLAKPTNDISSIFDHEKVKENQNLSKGQTVNMPINTLIPIKAQSIHQKQPIYNPSVDIKEEEVDDLFTSNHTNTKNNLFD